jgi:hypothetical protein
LLVDQAVAPEGLVLHTLQLVEPHILAKDSQVVEMAAIMPQLTQVVEVVVRAALGVMLLVLAKEEMVDLD